MKVWVINRGFHLFVFVQLMFVHFLPLFFTVRLENRDQKMICYLTYLMYNMLPVRTLEWMDF